MPAAPTFGVKVLALAAILLAAPTFAAAPSAAIAPAAAGAPDVRPEAYNVGGALALGDNTGFQFLSSTGPVRLDIGTVTNESVVNTSGSVRVGLFVTTGPSGTVGTYWTIAWTDLGSLQAGFYFEPFSRTVPYAAPPDGVYFLHMGVFEYEPATCLAPSGYCLDDYVSFVNRVEVIGGQIFDAGLPPVPQAIAVEYYHALFGHYFTTSYVNEIQLLDAGAFPNWRRTNRGFNVWTADNGTLAGVCRFFSTSFAPRSSHFYSPYADECAIVLGNPNWQYETIAFYVELPDTSGNCAPGRQPLYRLYNDSRSGAPNHRYTTSLEVRLDMVSIGWISEGWGPLGTIACVPV
jgi:hypothetical protein